MEQIISEMITQTKLQKRSLSWLSTRIIKYEKVAVSSIVRRADSLDLDVKIMNVNRILEQELPKHGIDFINNDNIQDRNLDRWGLHLNYTGKNLLTGNFIKFLSNA